MTEISEVQQKVVRKGDTGIEASHRRVFLLGENRWEEPSRLASSDGLVKSKKKDATTKCLQCRGEGRLLCTGMYGLVSLQELSYGTCGDSFKLSAKKYLGTLIWNRSTQVTSSTNNSFS